MKIRTVSNEVERGFAELFADQFDLLVSGAIDAPILNTDNGNILIRKNKRLALNIKNFREFTPFNPLRDSKLTCDIFASKLQTEFSDIYVLEYSLEYDKRRPNFKRLWVTTRDSNGINRLYTHYYLNESVCYIEAIMLLRGDDIDSMIPLLQTYDIEE